MASSDHILTIDVEDGPQAAGDQTSPDSERVMAHTLEFLQLLEDSRARATFFILGKVAEKHPELARQIAEAGHEVASLGYSHDSLESMTGREFKERLHRSVEILREQTGAPVYGHRAAGFSISLKRLYYLEYMMGEGLKYDSSIMPVVHPHYGIPGAYAYPHFIRCASRQLLIEFPPSTMRLGRVALSGAGGGYFRLLPYWWTKLALRSFERAQKVATCYFHSYDIAAREIAFRPNPALAILRLRPSIKCASIMPKLRRLLADFHFTTMNDACNGLAPGQLPVGLDLAILPIRYGNIPIRLET